MRMYHFWAQNTLIYSEQNFLIQIIVITSIYLLVPFILQNFKKPLETIQSYEDVPFLSPKWPISPNDNFFQKNC